MSQFIKALRTKWEENPLPIVIWLAIFVRLVSVIFAKGWGMLDDHFLIIEVPWSWVNGWDVNKWLPWTPGNHGPEGHSFLYVGLHYLLFLLFKFLGLEDPQTKMFVVRFLHAAFSLITVYYGYKIALRYSNKKQAGLVGLLLAVYWFVPWISVRNLVEIVATPLLMLGTWLLLTNHEKKHPFLAALFAGLLVGFAFSVRYQTGIYGIGFGLVLLFQKQWKTLLAFSLGGIVAILAIQGAIDMAIWGRPFAEMGEYIGYNVDNRYKFYNGDWYNYFLLLGGILIPPISLFIMIGVFKNWRNKLLLFVPAILFFAFHSYFPNKQERFILTIVPFIVILGITGWYSIYENSNWWQKRQKLYKGIWVFFWVINFIVLIPISTMYSKRSRAEAMTYLSQYKNIVTVMAENSPSHKVDILPQFYANQKILINDITTERPIESYDSGRYTNISIPRFVLFYTNKDLDKRVAVMQKYYPELVYETTVEPGFVDNILFILNPKNTNQSIFIYRNTKYFPKKVE